MWKAAVQVLVALFFLALGVFLGAGFVVKSRLQDEQTHNIEQRERIREAEEQLVRVEIALRMGRYSVSRYTVDSSGNLPDEVESKFELMSKELETLRLMLERIEGQYDVVLPDYDEHMEGQGD